MNYLERIKELTSALGIKNVKTLQEQLGVSSSYFNNTQRLTQKIAKKIEELYPEVNIEWLLTGKGTMFRQQEEKTVIAQVMPLIPLSMVSNGIRNFDLDDTRTIVRPNKNVEVAFLLTGESMMPAYPNGTYLFGNPASVDLIQWGMPYVIDMGTEAICRHLKRSEKEDYVLAWSPNPEFPEIEIEMSKIVGLYRISIIMIYP